MECLEDSIGVSCQMGGGHVAVCKLLGKSWAVRLESPFAALQQLENLQLAGPRGFGAWFGEADRTASHFYFLNNIQGHRLLSGGEHVLRWDSRWVRL